MSLEPGFRTGWGGETLFQVFGIGTGVPLFIAGVANANTSLGQPAAMSKSGRCKKTGGQVGVYSDELAEA